MYDNFYKEFCNEVHRILSCYIFWKMINNRAVEDRILLSALNRTPLSWTVIRQALLTTLFITLGRIFDTNDDAYSVDDLLKCCINEIDLFNLENLKKRKMKDTGDVEPDWLPGYLQESYEPRIEDFQRLKSEVARRRNVFNSIYRPIRHKIIAHADKAYMDNADVLWGKTNIGQLEEVIWFLFDLKETLFDTYQNGRKPELKGRNPDIELYESDFGRLLDGIKNLK